MIVETEDSEVVFKLIVVGDSGCGKTSIVRQYVDGVFSAHYQASIGLHFAQKSLMLGDNKLVKLQLWDIAGQDRYREMTHVYYRDSAAGVVVCDASRPQTILAARVWRQDIETKLGDVPVILLVNKVDLLNKAEQEQIKRELDVLSKELKLSAWYFTSAKDDVNLKKAFQDLTEVLTTSPSASQSLRRAGGVIIKARADAEAQRGGCPC